MNEEQEFEPLSADELAAEGITALPDKEVGSILDLNVDLNLGIQAAAPIDLGVAANANVAAPIDASASANVLSFGSTAAGVAHQGVLIDQGINAGATANSAQDSSIGHAPAPAAAPAPQAAASPAAVNGSLLNVDVKLDANAALLPRSTVLLRPTRMSPPRSMPAWRPTLDQLTATRWLPRGRTPS